MLQQAHIYVKGRVVGVGFRAWTKTKSKEAGAVGWIRNVYNKPGVFGPSGGVEIVVQGTKTATLDIIDFVRVGPPAARVDSIDVTYQQPEEKLKAFIVLKSAA